MMKYRAVLFMAVLLGISSSALGDGDMAGPRNPPGAKQIQNPMGPDISQSDFKSWQTPAASDNPGSLFPRDGTSISNAQLDKLFNQGNSASLEGSKPIEIETSSAQALPDEPIAATPTPKHHQTKLIMLIIGAIAALLVFQKFRKLLAGPAVQKPSFL
jgi:hypothetical protein